MKLSFAAVYLGLLAAATSATEIDKIEAKLVPKDSSDEAGNGKARKVAPKRDFCHQRCNVKPLDADMLIAKYDMNLFRQNHIDALSAAVNGNLQLGGITQNIAEANDAARVGARIIDGLSGDVNFPHGDIKPLLTVGEINMCEENHGEVYVGVPDGMGAMLKDDETLRLVVQSESYGPLLYESIPYPVNGGSASFTGSHVQYTDFDREGLAMFLTHSGPASDIIKGFGQVATKYYNLNGELIGPRNPGGPTGTGAHFSNTDVDGNWAVREIPTKADWLMQSLCSAHLEEKHQFGDGIGFEDDIYITNEEWMRYADDAAHVGLSMHAIDLANGVDYAVGSVTNSGFEKIVELNPQHTDYVILGVSGYNGDFSGSTAEVLGRNAEYGRRPDGSDYFGTANICPARIYIGMKGKMEDGSDAPEEDFLARNGLRYGKVYGFAIDMGGSGPTNGLFRDSYHKPRENGAKVDGKFVAIDWMWDGVAKNFRHDGAWHFQIDVPGYTGTDMKWWNSKSLNSGGLKTEHLTPDTRPGKTAFIQGSTAGYFGHYYIHDVKEVLNSMSYDAEEDFPSELNSTYFVYQGENDITVQIDLNGDGLYATVGACPGASDATVNCDSTVTDVNPLKKTFEDIDGLEVIAAKEGLFAIIQEDSGNDLGERMFISSPLEHEADGNELTYKFMAMSGGMYNSRMQSFVGIPADVSGGAGDHEFSGVIDLSGMLAKKDRTMFVRGMSEGEDFVINAHDGKAKRDAEFTVPINEKLIVLGLQAHNYNNGVIQAFQADRGGQVLLYQPDI